MLEIVKMLEMMKMLELFSMKRGTVLAFLFAKKLMKKLKNYCMLIVQNSLLCTGKFVN